MLYAVPCPAGSFHSVRSVQARLVFLGLRGTWGNATSACRKQKGHHGSRTLTELSAVGRRWLLFPAEGVRGGSEVHTSLLPLPLQHKGSSFGEKFGVH